MKVTKGTLNLLAMSTIAAGALITTVTEPGSTLNGALWGALLSWMAAAKANGEPVRPRGGG